MSKPRKVKRNLFAEIMQGIEEMALHREGKITLRTHRLPAAKVEESPGAEFFVAAREKFNVSRAAWANMLRVSPRTVEKWEQGGHASPLAATFVDLVLRYPDTLERLQTLPRRLSRGTYPQPSTPRSITVRELFDWAGAPVHGPVPWNDPVTEKRAGVYVVAVTQDPDVQSGLADPGPLGAGLVSRWNPSQAILYVGQTTRPLSKRIGEFYRHVWGARSPHRGGQDIKLLSCPLWVYWSPTDQPDEAEFRMIEEFEARAGRLPFANMKRPARPLLKPEKQVAFA